MQYSKLLKWNVCDSIGVITINNAPQNRIEEAEFVEFDMMRKWISQNPLKGLIITGKGRHFSAGANTDNIYEKVIQQRTMEQELRRGRKILDYIERLPIPTVAAISGMCFGAGLEIALSCHIRVCGENALFAFPESNHGLLPGLSGTVRLPRQVGVAKSLELILSGEAVTAVKALEIKLVDYVVPKKQVFDFSIDLLRTMTANKPLRVIHAIVTSINNTKYLAEEEAMEAEAKMFCQLALQVAEKHTEVTIESPLRPQDRLMEFA
ncbi:MAG: enoyl-CoA hydratase/isomerase family protein [Desulfobulbaceae bacterium]|nr:enoyl-CoA hydratase/isomerase family protein [Desulfobulbaceae bacterium]